MIVAHHAGEHLILLLMGSGAGAGPLLLVLWKTRLGRLIDRMMRR